MVIACSILAKTLCFGLLVSPKNNGSGPLFPQWLLKYWESGLKPWGGEACLCSRFPPDTPGTLLLLPGGSGVDTQHKGQGLRQERGGLALSLLALLYDRHKLLSLSDLQFPKRASKP